jgi:hypothetical protein
MVLNMHCGNDSTAKSELISCLTKHGTRSLPSSTDDTRRRMKIADAPFRKLRTHIQFWQLCCKILVWHLSLHVSICISIIVKHLSLAWQDKTKRVHILTPVQRTSCRMAWIIQGPPSPDSAYSDSSTENELQNGMNNPRTAQFWLCTLAPDLHFLTLYILQQSNWAL